MEFTCPLSHVPPRLSSSYHRRRCSPLPIATTRRRRLMVISRGSSGGVGMEKVEQIRVCVNRSCSRQGSRETLSILSDIAPPGVSVISCGCLGRCGAGPNLVILPGEVLVGHCGTTARAAELLANLYCYEKGGGLDAGEGFDPWKSLDALVLRKKGEEELVEKGNPSQAEALLSQAIALKPPGGLHTVYKSRSAARLAMGDTAGALEDANEASRLAPEFPQAYICQGDVFMALEEWDAAEKAYSTALQFDPSIRRSKSFKARVTKLQQRLATVNTSS